jgi:PPP family 3-phenylpropionic acid transporter
VRALRLYLFAYYLGLGAVLPLLALGLAARGFRPSQYAWLMVLIPLSRLFAPPLWGVLADRYLGAMRLLRANTALAALSMAGLFLAESLAITVIAFAVWAFTSSSLVPLVEATAYRLLGGRASRFGYLRVFGSIGFATSAIGLGVLGVDREIRAPFALAALGYFAAAFATLGLSDVVAPTRAPLLPAIRRLAVRADVLLLWLGSMLYYVAHGAFDSYFGPFARTLPNVSAGTVSGAWALGVTTEVVVIWFVPRWLDGRARRILLVGSAAVAALRWGLLANATNALDLWLQQPLHGVTFGVWYLAFVHENQARADVAIRATVQGIAQACIGAGMVASTLLGGYVVEQFGGRTLFRAAVVAALLATACYGLREWSLLRREPRLASAAPES